MKKSLKVLIASSALILAGTLLAGCEEKVPVSQIHEHTFSTEWSANDGAHWHAATCEHTSVMSEVEDHKFGTWSQTKAPTQTEEGSQKRTCTVCGYEQVSTIAKLEHTHVFKTEWSKDAEYHWHDATCHENVRADVAKHRFGEYVLRVQPQEGVKGLKVATCQDCGYEDKVEVDATEHVHTYEENWTTNESSHWKKATCDHKDSFKEFGAHQFGDWYDEVPSSETVAGSHKKKCSVCDYVLTETLPLAEHTHLFSNEYSHDDEYHWYDATCGHDVYEAKEAHSFGDWEDVANSVSAEYPNGKQSRKCSECDYVQYRAKAHEHSLSDWISDETSHWKVCNAKGCDEAFGTKHNEAAHTWDRSYATAALPKKCSDCGYVDEIAWKDANQPLPNQYMTLYPQSTRAYTFELLSRTNFYIHIFADVTSNTSGLYFDIYGYRNDGSIYILYSSYYLRDGNFIQSSKTYDAGTYVIVFRNATTDKTVNFLAYNASHVYTKTKISELSLKVGDESQLFTMYRYSPRFDVSTVQYTVENASGEEVYLIRNPRLITAPTNFTDGYASFVEGGGSTRYIGLPRYIHRSDAILNYNPAGSVYSHQWNASSQSVSIWPNYNRILNAYKNDEFISKRLNTQNFTASISSLSNPYDDMTVQYVSWFASLGINTNAVTYWTDTQWTWDGSKYVSDIYGEACGFNTNISWTTVKNHLNNYASDAVFDATNKVYQHRKLSGIGPEQRIVRLENLDTIGGYSTFYWTNVYPATSMNYSMTNRSYMTILDSSFKTVTDYFVTSSGKLYKDNSKQEFFEVKQNETYYFLLSTSWVTTSSGWVVFDQTRYNVTIDAGELSDELDSAVADNSIRKGEYISGNSLNDYADAVWDIPEDKLIAYWEDEDGNFINTSDFTSFQALDHSTYTAHWIDKKDVLATAYSITDWDDMDDSFEFQILDPNLGVMDDDAVVFVYIDGTEVERMIYNSSTTVPLTSEDGSLYFYFEDYTDGMSTDFLEFEQENLLYIYLKREYQVTLSFNNIGAMDPGDYEINAVPKAGGFDFPTFEHHDYVEDGYYFAGWDTNISATAPTYLDGGHADPIRDTTYYAIFCPTADSKVVSLGEGIDGFGFKFVTNYDDDKEYLELQILDPNLTITYSGSATTITLVDKAGNTKSAAVVAMKGSSWGDLTTATRASGTIRIRLSVNSVSHDDIANAVKLIVA